MWHNLNFSSEYHKYFIYKNIFVYTYLYIKKSKWIFSYNLISFFQFGLRQLDLSLLAQLWSLNESIQEFRQLLQEQEDRAPSPSPSSEEGDDTSYGTHPPPPPRRPAPGVHLHRPPRPPRLPRPPPNDESPSSEEYGAVWRVQLQIVRILIRLSRLFDCKLLRVIVDKKSCLRN